MLKMRYLLVLLILVTGIISADAKDKKEDNQLNYEIESAGATASQGYYNVKVTVIASNPKKVDDDLIARCAVHGVLFKGFAGANGHKGQKPLAGSAATEGQHADFYKTFFSKGGTARNYASVMTGGREMKRVDKNYYVSAIVSVSKDQLKHDLEKEGVVRGLNSGF